MRSKIEQAAIEWYAADKAWSEWLKDNGEVWSIFEDKDFEGAPEHLWDSHEAVRERWSLALNDLRKAVEEHNQ